MARSRRRSTPSRVFSSWAASRKLPRTAAAGTDGAETVAADVADDGPYAVLGGRHFVQVAADAGAPVRGEVDGGDGQTLDPWRRGPQQHALGGLGDPAGVTDLAEHAAPEVQDDPGSHGAQHGAADQARAEGVVPGERAGQPVGHRDGAPRRRHREGAQP